MHGLQGCTLQAVQFQDEVWMNNLSETAQAGSMVWRL